MKGKRHTKEAKPKNSLIRRGKKQSPEAVGISAEARRVGRKVTEETRQKISRALKSRKRLKQARLNMSLSHLGMKRGRQSEEHKRKLSESIKRLGTT